MWLGPTRSDRSNIPSVLFFFRNIFLVGWGQRIYIEFVLVCMYLHKCIYTYSIYRTGTSMTIFVFAMWVLQGWSSTVDIITWVLQFYRYMLGCRLTQKQQWPLEGSHTLFLVRGCLLTFTFHKLPDQETSGKIFICSLNFQEFQDSQKV